MTLDKLAIKFGTDKASTHHNYTEIYERIFSPLRQSVKGLIEIGIGGQSYKGAAGGSLRMWESYFGNANIVGLDMDPTTDQRYGERIKVVIGDQTSRSALNKVLKVIARPNIIVDDGSHRNNLTIASFEYLWRKLAPGGIYVIDDTLCGSEQKFGNHRSDLDTFLLSIVRGIETNGRILTKGNKSDLRKYRKINVSTISNGG